MCYVVALLLSMDLRENNMSFNFHLLPLCVSINLLDDICIIISINNKYYLISLWSAGDDWVVHVHVLMAIIIVNEAEKETWKCPHVRKTEVISSFDMKKIVTQ